MCFVFPCFYVVHHLLSFELIFRNPVPYSLADKLVLIHSLALMQQSVESPPPPYPGERGVLDQACLLNGANSRHVEQSRPSKHHFCSPHPGQYSFTNILVSNNVENPAHNGQSGILKPLKSLLLSTQLGRGGAVVGGGGGWVGQQLVQSFQIKPQFIKYSFSRDLFTSNYHSIILKMSF